MLGAGIRVTGSRLHSRVSSSVHARLPWPASFTAATVRSGQQWCTHARGRCLTLQSTGRHPASRVPPVISNVRHRQMRSARASCQHWHSNLRRSVGVATWEHIELKLVQKVGPPLAHAVTHSGIREASSLVLRRSGFSGSRRTALFSPSAAISRQCTLDAWCGYQGHGQPLARKGELVSSREAFVACELHGRYSAFRPAVVHACAWPLPNPSIERTCPGKPGQASHLKR